MNLGEDNSTDSDFHFSPRRKPKKDFFRALSTSQNKSDTNELDLFLADDSTDVLSLLKYPTLKKMFRKYNTALPSSASAERLFRVAGKIFQPCRSLLSDEPFEKMIFFKVNRTQ